MSWAPICWDAQLDRPPWTSKEHSPLNCVSLLSIICVYQCFGPFMSFISIYLHGYAILRYASTKPALAVMFLFKEFHLVDQGNQWRGGAWLRGFIGKSAVRIFVNNEISSYFSDDNCCVPVNNCVCNRAAAGQKLVSSWESVSCHYLVIILSCRPQMGPMLAPWTLQSGYALYRLLWQAMQSTHINSLRMLFLKFYMIYL